MSATETTGQVVLAGSSVLAVTLGLEPQALVWALVGSILGVTLAKPSGRLYAVALFVAATLTCALLGTVGADYFFKGSVLARNAIAVLIGAGFHPALSAFMGAVPGLVDSAKGFIQRRIGGQ